MNGLGMYRYQFGYVIGYPVFCEYVATEMKCEGRECIVREASLATFYMN